MAVVGEEYPLPPLRALFSRVVSILQIGIFVLPFLVTRIPAVINHPYYRVFEQRKMMFLIGGYFILNMLQTQISSTGAFEIYLDHRLIFSKLSVGRMPNASELSKLIRWYLYKKCNDPHEKNTLNIRVFFE